ncbi:MAG TPA: hypothetical protein DEA50_08295 [Parvularcula sp.]|nr:hypothetical protein [Parvularcula sp.]
MLRPTCPPQFRRPLLKRSAVWILAATTGNFAAGAAAQTLDEALALAYSTNPQINAERAQLDAVKEGIAQARAGGLPQITASAGYEKVDSDQSVNSELFSAGAGERSFKLNTATADVRGEQQIFAGLRNVNAIRQARARAKAGGAQLFLVEQDILVQAATAYFGVVRDMIVFKATENNVEVLLKQNEETAIRFEIGEVTKTDVAQSEARLAQARARMTDAQAELAVSRATFEQIIGQMPGTLEEAPALPEAPATLDDAKTIARELSPVILQAQMSEQASRRGVAIAKGAFSPTVSLTAGYRYAEEPSSFIAKDEQFSYGVRMTAPLFLGGLNLSRVREANAVNTADRRRIDAAEREVDSRVTAGWQRLAAARANIMSSQTQVRASALALSGVRREEETGLRSTLDVLDAEQEYLDAQVALANAEHDARAATFRLLAAIGILTPESLGSQASDQQTD